MKPHWFEYGYYVGVKFHLGAKIQNGEPPL